MTPKDLSQAIERMQGMPDWMISEKTGVPEWKIKDYRQAAGIKGFPGPRMSRRGRLLSSAAGLVVSIEAC